MYEIVVSMLPVGQGAMNLIEVYEREGFSRRLENLTMIDCGFMKNASLLKNTLNSVKYATEQMRRRFEQGDGIYLDNLIFTHRDLDHWTLFDNLWEELFGPNYYMKEAAFDHLEGVRWLDNHESVSESYYMYESAQTEIYVYQKYFESPSELSEPNFEISGKITYRADKRQSIQEVRSQLFYSSKSSGGIFRANWDMAGLSMKAYVPECDENFLNVKLARANSGFILHGFFKGEDHIWFYEGKYPQEDSEFRQFIAEFTLNVLGGMEEFKDINVIESFLREWFVFKGIGDIIETVKGGVEVSNVIGSVFVGGNTKADFKKGKTLTRVGEMLKRARIASKHGVTELKKDDEIPILDPITLLVLERLDLDGLKAIPRVEGNTVIDAGILNNGTSAVSVLFNRNDDGFQKFFFPGDATVHTFYGMILDLRHELFCDAVWTAPHHGSQRTISGEGDDEKMVFPFLLKNTTPRAMVITAGFNNRHGHPNFSFMRWISEYFRVLRRRVQKHSIVFNLNDSRNGEWRYIWSRFPMYTSLEPVGERGGVMYQNHRFFMSEPFYSYKYSKITQYQDKWAFIYECADNTLNCIRHEPLSMEKRCLQAEEIPTDTLFMNGSRAAF